MTKKSQELLLKSLTFINYILENKEVQKIVKNEEVTFWQGAYAGMQIGAAGVVIEKAKLDDLLTSTSGLIIPGHMEPKKKPGRPKKPQQ